MLKAIFLFLIIIFSTLDGTAQNQESEIRSFVQKKAEPKEGLKVFFENFVKQFQTPYLPNHVTQLKIKLKFVVEKDGSFSNIKSIDDVYDVGEEAIRVLKLMPNWNPAMHNQELVRSSFTLPITINVKDPQSVIDEVVLKSPTEIDTFLSLLKNNTIDTELFEFSCNCGLYKSSFNDDLKTESFMLVSYDNDINYNIVFRNISEDLADNELKQIEEDALNQGASVKQLQFQNRNAIEISFYKNSSNSLAYYNSLFMYKNNYLIGVSIVGEKKQLVDLLFNHLKDNLKLKI